MRRRQMLHRLPRRQMALAEPPAVSVAELPHAEDARARAGVEVADVAPHLRRRR